MHVCTHAHARAHTQLHTKKILGPDNFTSEFYKTWKMTSKTTYFLLEYEERRTLSCTFYEVGIQIAAVVLTSSLTKNSPVSGFAVLLVFLVALFY